MKSPYNIVLLPVRNEEKIIRTCLDNILKNPDVDKVVIVCDRCTDKTNMIVNEISRINKKCIVVEKKYTKYNKGHLGHYTGEARNEGLKVVAKLCPDYIILVDADSTLPADHISNGTKILNKDKHVGLVGIKLVDEEKETDSVIDVGSIIRYSIIQKWGGKIKESARDITTMTEMLIAEGHKTHYIKYNDERSILEYDPNDYKLSRKYWGYTGIGYAGYERHEPFLWWSAYVFKHMIMQQKFHEIIYLIGWISGYLNRANRIDELKAHSHKKQRIFIKNMLLCVKQLFSNDH